MTLKRCLSMLRDRADGSGSSAGNKIFMRLADMGYPVDPRTYHRGGKNSRYFACLKSRKQNRRREECGMLERYYHWTVFPGHSFIHKMDPRMKIIASVLYIVILFVASRPLGLLLGILMRGHDVHDLKISAKMVAKSQNRWCRLSFYHSLKPVFL